MGQRVLPLQAATDQYSYFSCPRTQFVTVQVFNNGVDIGYGTGSGAAAGAAVYPPNDEYLALQTATYPRICDEIRIKNHVPGQVAQVQITAQGAEDLPPNPLGVSVTPNFLTINADGTVGATFSGIIKAKGVSLPPKADPAVAPGPANQVTWQRTSDGASVAIVTAWDRPGVPDAGIQIYGGAKSDLSAAETNTYAELIAAGQSSANLIVAGTDTSLSSGASVSASAGQLGGQGNVLIISQDNRSSFIQDPSVIGLPGLAVKRYLGDFALEYANASAASYGPGIGNPFNSTGIVVAFDDGVRLSGASYICRNTGLYLVGWSMTFAAAGACNANGGVQRAGFALSSSAFVPSSLLFGCVSGVAIVPCTAGDVLAPTLGVGANASIQQTHPTTGTVCTYWWAGQIR